MSKQVIPFNFENHAVRTVVIEDNPWWVGKDVCTILGYKDTVNALKQHCNGVAKHHPIVDSLGRKQEVRIINEGDVFRLITHSKRPSAQRFENWLYDEVLPQIRRTGAYVPASAELTLNKNAVVQINTLLMKAERRMIYLEDENDLLRNNKHLHETIDRLQKQLNKKNTPLSKYEREQILALKDSFSAVQIARVLNRSASAVSRVIKEGKV